MTENPTHITRDVVGQALKILGVEPSHVTKVIITSHDITVTGFGPIPKNPSVTTVTTRDRNGSITRWTADIPIRETL